MTDRPIIFSATMIRALLDGTKTQTRRVLNPQPWLSMTGIWHWEPSGKRPWCDWHDGPPYIPITDALAMDNVPCAIGDRLWVRERLTQRPMKNILTGEQTNSIVAVYAADNEDVVESTGFNVVPWWDHTGNLASIHMPRMASRLTLEVTGVKVERVKEISEEDAIAEGIGDFAKALGSSEIVETTGETNAELQSRLRWPQRMFSGLWDAIHGPGAWEANPWVFCIDFKVHKCNNEKL